MSERSEESSLSGPTASDDSVEVAQPPSPPTEHECPPRVFISYSHDSDDHRSRVLELALRLRREGVDAWLDRFESQPAEGWPRWMERNIEKADFVLLLCSKTYRRRFDGREDAGKGLGVAWEAALLRDMLYRAKRRNERVIPVLTEGGKPAHIPTIFSSCTSYVLPSDYDALYRRLTRQPEVVVPVLGAKRVMPARNDAGSSALVHTPLGDLEVKSEGSSEVPEQSLRFRLGPFAPLLAVMLVLAGCLLLWSLRGAGTSHIELSLDLAEANLVFGQEVDLLDQTVALQELGAAGFDEFWSPTLVRRASASESLAALLSPVGEGSTLHLAGVRLPAGSRVRIRAAGARAVVVSTWAEPGEPLLARASAAGSIEVVLPDEQQDPTLELANPTELALASRTGELHLELAVVPGADLLLKRHLPLEGLELRDHLEPAGPLDPGGWVVRPSVLGGRLGVDDHDPVPLEAGDQVDIRGFEGRSNRLVVVGGVIKVEVSGTADGVDLLRGGRTVRLSRAWPYHNSQIPTAGLGAPSNSGR